MARCLDDVDFSLLPDVIWARVIKELPFMDRFKLRSTCQRMNQVVDHPSAWDSLEVELRSSEHNKRDIALLEKYMSNGVYLKNLKIACPEPGIDSVDEIIEAISRYCTNLKSLTLDVNKASSTSALCKLILLGKQLNKVYIRSWPKQSDLTVLECIRKGCDPERLECLSLFWESPDLATWSSMGITLPSNDEMLNVISIFNCLSQLSLRSSMLSETLIKELAKPCRSPLTKLNILLTYSERKQKSHLPDISGSSWQKLCKHCPELRVDVAVMTRMPLDKLMDFLRPELPVYSVGFMRYATISQECIDSLLRNYHHTLQRFVCRCDPDAMDAALISLVTACSKLTWLSFNGSLYHGTVLQLAEIQNLHWRRFEVFKEKIITDDPPPVIDNDLVLHRSDSGEVVLMKQHLAMLEKTEEEERQILNLLCDKVSTLVGYKWLPSTMNSLEEKVALGQREIYSMPSSYPIVTSWQWQ